MKVPLLDLEAHHKPIRDEILKAVAAVAGSNAFILGPEVKRLEESIAQYSGAGFAVGVSSGTDALLIALMALGIKAGDEVITTPYSFFATAGAVARLGAKPVFVDIDPKTFNINTTLIEAAVTPKTKAIIPVHLFGQVADMAPILAIAKKHGLKIIEDAAQSIGAEYSDGRRAGSMGDIGCFSFFPSKNLGCWGDAGMAVTNNPELAEKLTILRSHGSKPKYYHKIIGGNFRIDAIQAAVLNVKLKYLDGWTRKRQENAARYEQLFAKSGMLEKGIILSKAVYKTSGVSHYHIYNQFVLRVPERNKLQDFLKKEGIGCEVYYPVPFHLQECFGYLGYKMGHFPESEKAADRSLAIPIFPELTLEQQEYAAAKIAEFC